MRMNCVIWDQCLHIQLPEDMCTTLTYLTILDERSTKDAGGLTGEYDSIEKCFGDDF